MKRRDLLQHLEASDCGLVREGGRHSWWINAVTGRHSAAPHHREISDLLARKICRDPGVSEPR